MRAIILNRDNWGIKRKKEDTEGLFSPPPLFLDNFEKFVYLSMADQAHFNSPKTHLEIDPKNAIIYPVPLSPPLPLISKEIELSRAMTAASKSSLFSLSRTHVLFEDDWLLAVCKPQGVYCEAVLASVPSLLSASLHSDQVGEFVILFY